MMPFTILRGIAAPLPLADVDTDKIIPARFMKTILRSGLGKHLFDPLRYSTDGRENPDFILNQAPFRKSSILIARENFGCGSSREHAPWALLDFGIRCIIAPSFADIFASNCTKNGILPVVIPSVACEALLTRCINAAGMELTVNLERQVIMQDNLMIMSFEVDQGRRRRMLTGIDDIAETMVYAEAISSYETKLHRYKVPPIELDFVHRGFDTAQI